VDQVLSDWGALLPGYMEKWGLERKQVPSLAPKKLSASPEGRCMPAPRPSELACNHEESGIAVVKINGHASLFGFPLKDPRVPLRPLGTEGQQLEEAEIHRIMSHELNGVCQSPPAVNPDVTATHACRVCG